MNTKGNVRSYVAIVIILVCALIFIFYLLKAEKQMLLSKPMSEGTTTLNIGTTSTEESLSTTANVANENNDSSEQNNTEPLSYFQANLQEIFDNLGFFGNYDITKFYHGAEFNFKCTNYDESQAICHAGSALMKIGNALFPLYTYTNDSENYLLRREDYYIVYNSDLVLLYASKDSSGSARIFNIQGEQLGTLNNTLTSYKVNDILHNRLYPNIEDGRIYYYACLNNRVVINSVVIGQYKQIDFLEEVMGSCY